MKSYNIFIEKLNENKYYNSHGESYTMKEFIEIEVKDRANYTMTEIRGWMKKFNIKKDDNVI